MCSASDNDNAPFRERGQVLNRVKEGQRILRHQAELHTPRVMITSNAPSERCLWAIRPIQCLFATGPFATRLADSRTVW